MFVSDCLDVNDRHHLTIGGADTLELAGEYGTPLYVLDEGQFRKNCRDFTKSMRQSYGENGLVLYASKALCCKALCRICAEEGMGLDVVSGGELYTAIAADFPTEKICFHGNNKTPDELRMAVRHGVGRIIVDNIEELQLLEQIARDEKETVSILLRIKPGVEAHTHEFIRTGQIDSKFGFALETGEADEAVRVASSLAHVQLRGFHCHIGSQIFDADPFVLAAHVMMEFIARIKSETGKEYSELNLGGGFAIRYRESDPPSIKTRYMDDVSVQIRRYASQLGLSMPFVYIEPGRSIVGDAGLTLYTVGSVKTIPDIRTYVSVDGGMFDDPRYILYQSEYEVLCADRADAPRDTVVTVAGKCGESGDLIQENAPLQSVKAGDTLAVLNTGAYNYSMASNYNRNPRPAIVMVKNGDARVIVRRETYKDLIRCDD